METKLGSSSFNFRLAANDIQFEISGYIKKGVTPFNFNKKIPIFLSSCLADLLPQFFWVGGGHPELKLSEITIKKKYVYTLKILLLGVSLEEFIAKAESDIYIVDFTDPIDDITPDEFRTK